MPKSRLQWKSGLASRSLEVWNGIPHPKDWAIPERVAAAKRDDWTAPN